MAERSSKPRRAALLARRFGGTAGNEILTSATAVVLVALLAAEWYTVVDIGGLLTAHMFIGMVLIPPVALKLGSTGYRAVRYYAGARAYREAGPPRMPLRLMAPVLVASTVVMLVTGVMLLAAGHRPDTVFQVHKLSAIVFGVLLGVHFLAYLPRVVRSLFTDWRAARRRAVPGAGIRGMLVAAAIGGGAALALALLPTIDAWHGRH